MGKTLVSSSMIDRVVEQAGPAAGRGAGGLQVVRARICSTAPTASAGRRAPGRAFCGRTARSGRPTRTASSWTCWRRRSPRAPAKTRASTFRRSSRNSARPITRALTRPLRPSRRRGWRSCRPEAVKESDLAGEPITAKLTRAPGNNEPIGGLKVVTASGWFAARPSGTENLYKVYAESFRDEKHLEAIVSEGAEHRQSRPERRVNRRALSEPDGARSGHETSL